MMTVETFWKKAKENEVETEEMQVIAVDDDGGDILEKEKAEEMQVIAVDDDGGDILEKGKEEQIQIFAVDDDDGGELAGNIL